MPDSIYLIVYTKVFQLRLSRVQPVWRPKRFRTQDELKAMIGEADEVRGMGLARSMWNTETVTETQKKVQGSRCK